VDTQCIPISDLSLFDSRSSQCQCMTDVAIRITDSSGDTQIDEQRSR
jgi:hypothetical protein